MRILANVRSSKVIFFFNWKKYYFYGLTYWEIWHEAYNESKLLSAYNLLQKETAITASLRHWIKRGAVFAFICVSSSDIFYVIRFGIEIFNSDSLWHASKFKIHTFTRIPYNIYFVVHFHAQCCPSAHKVYRNIAKKKKKKLYKETKEKLLLQHIKAFRRFFKLFPKLNRNKLNSRKRFSVDSKMKIIKQRTYARINIEVVLRCMQYINSLFSITCKQK